MNDDKHPGCSHQTELHQTELLSLPMKPVRKPSLQKTLVSFTKFMLLSLIVRCVLPKKMTLFCLWVALGSFSLDVSWARAKQVL
jgi:hypothetical protein